MKFKDISVIILRLALGGIFAYFGFLAVTNPSEQAFWISSWVPGIFTSTPFIFAWGVFQLLIAVSLILGIRVRIGAFLAAGALLLITINLGFNEIFLRDIVLLAASLVLATREEQKWIILD